MMNMVESDEQLSRWTELSLLRGKDRLETIRFKIGKIT